MVHVHQIKNEMGGFFDFPSLDCDKFSKTVLYCLINSSDNNHFTFIEDGRQAIKKILLEIKDIQKKKCYLPSYICQSILQPFIETGLNINFYGHTHPLIPDICMEISDSLIFIIDYFGTEFIDEKKIKGLLGNSNKVIIDVTHSIFNNTRRLLSNDNLFYLASLRKVFPIPDGAIIYHAGKNFSPNLNYSMNDTSIVNAMILKNIYLSDVVELLQINPQEIKNYYLSLYKKSEEARERKITHINPISLVSIMILSNISYDKILEQREKNLRFLYQNTINNELCLFHYDSIKSPFIFPIILNNNQFREKLKRKLLRQNIFPPIHWEVENIVPKKFEYEHLLSKRILSIPIDQRYSTIDMLRISELINQEIP